MSCHASPVADLEVQKKEGFEDYFGIISPTLGTGKQGYKMDMTMIMMNSYFLCRILPQPTMWSLHPAKTDQPGHLPIDLSQHCLQGESLGP